ncbi:hypothetical protein D3C72_2381150 [compost metagenome]
MARAFSVSACCLMARTACMGSVSNCAMAEARIRMAWSLTATTASAADAGLSALRLPGPA